MDFLGFSSIFIGGNGSGTVPWTCFSAFDPIHKDRSKKQKDHSSKTKQKQVLQNLQVSAKGWGDYTTLAHWALLNESKWTWGKGWSLMWSSQRLKTLSCIQANPEALTFVLFQASSTERILIERESIFERWELDEQCRFWFACDKLINKILPWNCCRHIADDWWFVVILDAWHAFKDDMNPVVGSSSLQNKMETT